MIVYISKEQYEKLKEELKYLETEKRKEIANRLKNAIELGDISENAEYDIALQEKENLERRIAEIKNVLSNAKIIRQDNKSERILPGKKFEVIETKTNKKYTFTLVGFGESNPREGKISTESPLGKAFFSKKLDDIVEVQAPNGKVTYKIRKIY
jgi:transcription elongation factor GreA